jgi:hypothetical protein
MTQQNHIILGDMIPKVQEVLGTKVHFDNSLLQLPVYPLESNSSLEVVQWLQGVALANELYLDLSSDLVLLKGKDFARHTVVLQGKLSEKFHETATQMGWDIFPVGGANVIEYPVAHSDLIDTIVSIPRDPYKFEINITLVEEGTDKTKGFKLNDLVSFSVSQFDLLRFKKPYTVLTAPTLSAQRRLVDYLQDNTINLELTCVGGEEVIQRIDKISNIVTTSRDALGQTTSQQVQQFTSGFIFKLTAYPSKDHVLLHIDLEMSSDTGIDDGALPEISRKQVINTGYLELNEVWTCAQFQSKDLQSKTANNLFLPWKSDKKTEQTLLVNIKRVL